MTGFFEDHLNLDAIVAYVDGELSLVAYQRAAAHVTQCATCAADVAEQMFARDWLRSAPSPRMPGSLERSLFSIPVAMPLAAHHPGVAIDSRGHAVRVTHGGREVTRSRRFRFGAGALVAGIAVGAFATTGSSPSDAPVPATDVSGTIGPASVAPVSYQIAPGVPSESATSGWPTTSVQGTR